MNETERLEAAIAIVKKYEPNLRVSFKDDSRLHRLIGKILAFAGNRRYMDGAWTTIHNWIARPSVCKRGPYADEWQIILHEGQHVIDGKRIGNLTFDFIYLFPQVLGILGALYSLLLIPYLIFGGSLWATLGMLSLAFLAPFPAIGRAILEARAYALTLAVQYWTDDIPDEDWWMNNVSKIFSGGFYYYMFPFQNICKAFFKSEIKKLKDNPQLVGYLKDCQDLSKKIKG